MKGTVPRTQVKLMEISHHQVTVTHIPRGHVITDPSLDSIEPEVLCNLERIIGASLFRLAQHGSAYLATRVDRESVQEAGRNMKGSGCERRNEPSGMPVLRTLQ